MVSSLTPQQFAPAQNFGMELLNAVGQGQAIQGQRQDMNIRQQAADQQVTEDDYSNGIRKLTVLKNLATNARKLPDEQQRRQFIMNSAPALQSLGYTPDQISQQALDDDSLDKYISQLQAITMQTSQGQYRAESVSTNQGLMVFDPATKTYTPATGPDGTPLTAAQYDASLQGSITRTKEDQKNQSGLNYGPEQKRREEQAAADVKLATQPAITTAVDTAANEADADAKAKATAQKNANALAVYEKGISSVSGALANTSTGPIAGKLPAMTANQQIAEGSLAAMAPVLKSLFREAGEGTFTKEDQQVLMDMLPTRSDLPAARDAKLKNVDMLVRTKLQNQPVGASTSGTETAKQRLERLTNGN